MVRIDADTTTTPGAVRLHVQGQLDLEAVHAFGDALARAGLFRRPVELALGEVDFIDGSGLSVLMDAESRAQLASRELRIVAASRNVRRLIDFPDPADLLSPLAPVSGAQRGPVTNA